MKRKNRSSAFWMLTLPLIAFSQVWAKIPLTPGAIVNQFCQFDFSGARLHSRVTDPIWRLTIDNGDAPGDPVVLITGWEVVSSTTTGDGVDVKVSYNTVGSISKKDPYTVIQSGRKVAKTFHLSKTKGGLKIRLDNLQVSPHVSVAAFQQHVEMLSEVNKSNANQLPATEVDSKAQALSRLLDQLKAYEAVPSH